LRTAGWLLRPIFTGSHFPVPLLFPFGSVLRKLCKCVLSQLFQNYLFGFTSPINLPATRSLFKSFLFLLAIARVSFPTSLYFRLPRTTKRSTNFRRWSHPPNFFVHEPRFTRVLTPSHAHGWGLASLLPSSLPSPLFVSHKLFSVVWISRPRLPWLTVSSAHQPCTTNFSPFGTRSLLVLVMIPHNPVDEEV